MDRVLVTNVMRWLVPFCAALTAFSADIRIEYTDSQGEGFLDDTPVVAIGGNTGNTLGEQRRNVLEAAAARWGLALHSDVEMVVLASFDELPCTNDEAVLAHAAPVTAARDEPSFPVPFTWYPIALANALAERDLNADKAEAVVVVNASIAGSNACLSGLNWYLGLDGEHGDDIDLQTVLLHELAHALGFTTFTDLETGAMLFGAPDAFIRNLYDHTVDKNWNGMNNLERIASAINTDELVWDGTNVTDLAGAEVATGIHPEGGLRMAAPNPLDSDQIQPEPGVNVFPVVGLSVIHWAQSVLPAQLMQPGFGGAIDNLDLTVAAMLDLGWERRRNADLSLSVSVDNSTPNLNETIKITLTLDNDGPGLASAIQVQLRPDNGFSYIQHSTFSGDYVPSTGIWTPNSLASGSNAEIELTLRVASTGNLAFVAEVLSVSQGDDDSTPGNGIVGEDDDVRLDFSAVGELVNGAPITNLAGDQGDWRYFRFSVPAGQRVLQISSFGGIGDLDLYVKRGVLPNENNFDARPLLVGNAETVTIENPAAGDYFIGLFGFRAFEDANLRAAYSTSDLRLSVVDVEVASCPQIRIIVQAENESGVILDANDFSISENGEAPVTPVVEALGQGRYGLSYTTPIPNGGDTYPQISLNYDGEDTQTMGVYRNCTPDGGAVRSWIRDDHEVYPTQTVVIPIRVEPLEIGYRVNAFEIDLSFDSTVVEFVGLEQQGTLVEDWNQVLANGAITDRIFIAAADTRNLDLVADTDDILVGLIFRVPEDATLGSCSDIIFDRMVYDNGEPIALTDLGRVCIPLEPIGDPIADLEVRKEVDNLAPLTTESINFTLTVKNDGPDPATGLTLSDELPEGITFLSAEGDGAYDAGTGVWTVGTLFPDAAATITLTCRVDLPGAYTNCLEVRTVNEVDPDSTANNGDPDEDDLSCVSFGAASIGESDLSLVKTVDDNTPKVGDTVTFRLALTNDGPDPAFGVQVADRIIEIVPSGLSFISSDGVYDAASGVWAVGDVAVGATAILNLSYTVDTVSPVTNTAEVITSGRPDPDSTPNNRVESEDDQGSVTISPQSADLRLAMTVDEETPQVGQTVTLSLTLTNDGPDVAETAVELNLPADLNFLSTNGSYDDASSRWSVGTLNAGQSTTLDVLAQVEGRDPFDVFAQVAEADQIDPDSTPGNGAGGEDDEATVTLDPQVADLELNIITSNVSPLIGDPANITVTLTNQGPDAASGVQVQITFPAGFSYEGDDGLGAYSSGAGLWTVGDLTAGTSGTLILNGRRTGAGLQTVTAQVNAADQFDPDSSPANNIPSEDDQDLVSMGAADLELTLILDNTAPELGQEITATYTLGNDGPDPVTAPLVRLELPNQLVFVMTDGDYDVNSRIWTAPDLAVGAQAQLNVVLRVFGGAAKTIAGEVFQSPLGDPDSTPANGVTTEDDYASVDIEPECGSGASILIAVRDAPGEGFNDGTPVSPVGGNMGTTLGEQRLIAMQFAADIWAGSLQSNVDVVVEATFDQLTCSLTSGILGSAGPKRVVRDFPGAAFPNTWYPVALGNAISGADIISEDGDLTARFNSDVDAPHCLGNVSWYYGLDGSAGSDLDFVNTALHELGHGLGFLTLVNHNSGARFLDRDDIYMKFLKDDQTGKSWPQMSNGERFNSGVKSGRLVWTGSNVVGSSGNLQVGANAQGEVQMFAPNPAQPGSSVSHFDRALFPDELMEPSYTGNNDLSRTLDLFYDLGWACGEDSPPLADLELSISVDQPEPLVGQNFNLSITLTNRGPDGATGVRVRSILPDGLNYVGHSGGSYETGSGNWDIGDIASGQTLTLIVEVAATRAELIQTSAEVVGVLEADPDSIPNNQATDEDDYDIVDIIPRTLANADLSLLGAVNRAAPNPGDNVIFTFTVRNEGSADATGVRVRAPIASGLSFVSGDAGYNSTTGEWAAGAVAAGAQVALSFTTTVDREGLIELDAQITAADQPDPDSTPNNNVAGEDDQVRVTVFGQPDFMDCDQCARLIIVNTDGPGEGFNDPTPVDPIGGNPGTTLGEQRLNAMQYAADLFCGYLQSDTDILVHARFDALECDAQTGILGSAAPTYVTRNFPNAPFSEVWFPGALANALAKTDLNGPEPEMEAVFNSRLDDAYVSSLSSNKTDVSCFDEKIDYVVENNGRIVKFEDATLGLGEDRTFMADYFLINVQNGSNSVKVTTKAATSRVTKTVVGEGDSVFMNAQGFRVKLLSIQGDEYLFKVTAECQYHALSHIEFDFGRNTTVLAPTTAYQADRVSCLDLWTPDCSNCGGTGNDDDDDDDGDDDDDNRGGARDDDDDDDGDSDDDDDNGGGDDHDCGDPAPGSGDPGPGGGDPEPQPCLNGARWYYGYDRNAGTDIDFITVALHEMTHGLGFLTFVDLEPSSASRGARFLGRDDIFMTFLRDESTNLTWDQMSDGERFQSAGDVEGLVWDGEAVNELAGTLTGGVGQDGQIRMYASNPVSNGSTATHWSPSVTPDRLMEPAYTQPTHDPSLAVQALRDMGWTLQGCIDLELDMQVNVTAPTLGQTLTYTITLRNLGPNDASGVTLQSTLGSGLAFVSHSGATYDDATGVWTIGDVPADDVQILTLQLSAQTGVKSHILEVLAAGEPDGDSIPNNGNPFEDDYARIEVGAADLRLALTADKTEVTSGELVRLTYQLTNDGPDASDQITVTASAPSGFDYVTDDAGGAYDFLSGVWTVGGLAAGLDTTLTLTLRARQTGTSLIAAEVRTAEPQDPDSTPGNGRIGEDDYATAGVQVNAPQNDLAMRIDAIFPNGCPAMSARVIVTLNGQPLGGLTTNDFILRVDGFILPKTVTEDPNQTGTYWFDYTSPNPDGGVHVMDILLIQNTAFAYADMLFSTCAADGCTQLFNNITQPGLCGFKDSWRCFFIDVPPNQGKLTIDTFLGTGDADLFVRYGSPASTTEFDFRPALSDNNENVTIDFPQGGRWWIGVYGQEEYVNTNLRAAYWAAQLDLNVEEVFTDDCPSVTVRVNVTRDGQAVDWLTTNDFTLSEDRSPINFTLRSGPRSGDYELTFTTDRPDGQEHALIITANVLGDIVQSAAIYNNCVGDCLELTNNVPVPDLSGRTGSFRCFFIEVPSGFDVLDVQTFSGFGDSELFIRFGQQPTPTQFDFRPAIAGPNELQRIYNPQPGTWYIGVQGFTEYSGVNLLARYYDLNLGLDIEAVELFECPTVTVDVRVTTQNGGLDGLTAANFILREDAGDDIVPLNAEALGEGRYRLTYLTQNFINEEAEDPRDIILTAQVTFGDDLASDFDTFLSCSRNGGPVQFWINDDHAAPAGADIVIPVWSGPISDLHDIRNLRFQFDYDPSLIEYQGFTVAGTLLESWAQISDGATQPGQIRIDAAQLNADFPPLSARAEESVLILINFHVDDFAQPSQCTPLVLPREAFVINDGDPVPLVDDGMFCVISGCGAAIGDVDADGNAGEAFDSLQILNHLVDIPTVYDPIPTCVMDTNCSGSVALIDAVLVLQRATRIISAYCDGAPGGRSPGTTKTDAFEIQLQIGELTPGEPFEITIDLSRQPLGAVFGYAFDLNFDPTAIDITDVIQADTLTSRWSNPTVNSAQGVFSVAHINPYTPLDGLGALITLRGQAKATATSTSITFSRFELAEDSEPALSFDPVALDFTGQSCYDVVAFQQARTGWALKQTTILDLVNFLRCLPNE